MKQIKLRKGIYSSPLAFVCNILLVYVLYTVSRLVFLWSNWESFATGFDKLELNQLIVGSLMFDTSAILYTNALYALLLLLPMHYKERSPWKRVAKWVFVVVNGLCIAMNLADVVYFRFTGRRTTASVFQEFSHEGNLLSIVGKEVAHHPFLLLLGIVLIALLWVLYVEPRAYRPQLRPRWKYYVVQVVALGVFVPLCIGGMRGGFTTAVRPITLSNANQYVNQPAEAALVLNTPFSLLRTLTKKSFENPQYFTAEELEQIYSPLHTPRAGQGEMLRKNVVVLILESFGQEFVGALNKDLDGGKYKGATPLSRFSHHGEYHLRTVVCQRAQEHRWHAFGAFEHPDVCRTLLPHSGFAQSFEWIGRRTQQGKLLHGVFPWSCQWVDGLSSLC